MRIRPWHSTLAIMLCVLLALLPASVSASAGDRSPEYQMCVSSCAADACRDRVDDGTVFAHRLPWILRVMRWSCEDDCRYHCTHMVTNDAVDRVKRIRHEAVAEVESLADTSPISESAKRARIEGIVEQRLAQLRPVQKQMVQYHGKWVFIRFLGAQEPLSVLFSLLNLRVHAKAFWMLRTRLPDAYPLKLVYIVHTLISINAWLWSAVFHARDKNITEKLDYFSAASVIMSGFFFSACRLLRIPTSSTRFVVFRRICIGALALHVLYLSIGRFDYAYNMTANVVVGLVHTLLWLTYSIRPTTFPSNPLVDRSAYSRAAMRAAKPSLSNITTPTMSGAATPPVPVSTNIGPPSTSLKPRRRLQLILGLMTGAVMLELLDFPPILRLLDAHALWHLATIPITQMWYDWLTQDAQECVNTGWWLGDRIAPDMAANAATALEHISEKLKGRAASLAQNIELNALTNRLNELANKAGFSGAGNGRGDLGNGLGITGSGSGAASTSIGMGSHASGLTERESSSLSSSSSAAAAMGTSGGGSSNSMSSNVSGLGGTTATSSSSSNNATSATVRHGSSAKAKNW
ncbi:Per1-domain-containing protein [Testicularia cyperi]|uniref:Per1-domain-containing protein n=1 Tax=Testicularia cyperi TaxID=1882483 RepID=A0A317XIV6_9BASI|nr:Per1-domain-containing protein [Testicularia cyperi]